MPIPFFLPQRPTPTMTKSIMIMTMALLNLLLTRSSNTFPIAPALYVFGDSLFDNGNNNFLPTLVRANFSPYGLNFHGGATGRFTNGKTIVDLVAEFLKLPYPPPYLSLRGETARSDQLSGMNFASGGCGILPQSGSHLGRCVNFDEQIDLFARTVEQELPKHYRNSNDLSNYLSKSVFMITIGSNDYLNNYLLPAIFNSSRTYTPEAFAKHLVDSLSLQLQRLYRLGARKVIMFEIGPIGCIPSNTRIFKHTGQCVEDINKFVTKFNNHLAPMLLNLTLTLQGSYFILGRVFWIAYDVAINPAKYGLADSSNPCCETWANGTLTCIPELTALACRDPNRYFFWDGYHLTETIYKIIASHCLSGSSVCIPRNIEDLVSEV